MVRATFAGFSTAYSALQANQKRLDITGQNLANMNTIGYTRQQLQVSSLNYTNPVSHYMSTSEVVVGFGVHMDTVTQIRDPYLDIQYRNQMQKSGYSNALQTSFDELANFLDESQITGIQKAFDDIQSTLTNIHDSAKVNDQVYETELRTRMQSLTNLLNDAARQIDTAKRNEYNRLDGTGTNEQGAVQQVNDILQQIGRLNRQIKQNQIVGQPSLELMDERNVLLDELSSYIPIEVTYYKDKEHDGVDANGDTDSTAAKGEKYHLDSSGNIIMKKEWPDDLRVSMSYTRTDNGVTTTKQIVLVEGTVGQGDENFARLDISTNANEPDWDFSGTRLKFTNCFKYPTTTGEYGTKLADNLCPVFRKTNTGIANQFPSGSIQASLDMLWKDGETPGINDVRGYDYYMNRLDDLAFAFATVFNSINRHYTDQTGVAAQDKGTLLTIPDENDKKNAAKNIKISQDWINSQDPYIGTSNADNYTDCVLDLLEAMTTKFPSGDSSFIDNTKNPPGSRYDFTGLKLENNTFSNYMNHVSTVLANDSYANQNSLKTNVTVLNGIQNSRDSVSGVSLDEEASNMMMYMSAYNAASRLMTTLDQALDVLINSTGVVGR